MNCSGWPAISSGGELRPGAGRDLEIINDPRHSQQSRDLALPLNLSMTHELFQARHARFTMSNLLNFFALDGNNPCSIYSCVEMAWNNAHAVRGSLSAEVWESINATRIELRTLRQQGWASWGATAFLSG
ncbi:Bacterial domain of uncharacterised function (DUF403) [Klebsiella pneumoniae]|uniref:Bacterial domain of uncharacterized function (DUF403) n=1 Tax=Klebsiella pneumoniae TaxID=573 RepID=A0A2X3F581_KLEPN|nr:Bacterial domain of uncharacterised function (DUF403) [Klebsiella pneumoniae]